MSSLRIKRVFEESLSAREALPLYFTPDQRDQKLKGVLLSTDITLSLTFSDGTDLSLNQQTDFNSLETAPDKRIIRFERPLEGKLVKGTVRLAADSPLEELQARVFFMIEQKR